MGEWISVKDQLPKHNEDVRVKNSRREGKSVFILCKHDMPFWYFESTDKRLKPTHWMSLSEVIE